MKEFAKEDTINRVIEVVVNDLLKEITAGRLENLQLRMEKLFKTRSLLILFA